MGGSGFSRRNNGRRRSTDEGGEGFQGAGKIISGGAHPRQGHGKDGVELRSEAAGNAARADGAAVDVGLNADFRRGNRQDAISDCGSDSERELSGSGFSE